MIFTVIARVYAGSLDGTGLSLIVVRPLVVDVQFDGNGIFRRIEDGKSQMSVGFPVFDTGRAITAVAGQTQIFAAIPPSSTSRWSFRLATPVSLGICPLETFSNAACLRLGESV